MLLCEKFEEKCVYFHKFLIKVKQFKSDMASKETTGNIKCPLL